MQNIWLSLHLNLTHAAPEGPGWYVGGVRDEGVAILPSTRVDYQKAAEIAQIFETCFPTDHTTPSQIVESGNHLIHQAIETQLKEAEAQALRVTQLRKLLVSEAQ